MTDEKQNRNCIDDDRLIAFVDSDLSHGSEIAVVRHLDECNACRQKTERLRTSIESAKSFWGNQLVELKETSSVPRTFAMRSKRVTIDRERQRSRQLLGTSVLVAGVLLAVCFAVLRSETAPKNEHHAANIPVAKHGDSDSSKAMWQVDGAKRVSAETDESELILASIAAYVDQQQQAARLKHSLELLESVDELSSCASESKSYLRNRNLEAMQ